MRVAVLCPTRDRPDGLARLASSLGTRASLFAYVDGDQRDLYDNVVAENLSYCVGERIGPVASANALVQRFPDFDAYGLITDDAVVTTPGWDQWLLEVFRRYPYAVVSPYHNMGNHVDMPFVSRQWIETVGWFACPACYHYCWPTVHSLIGDMTMIVHSGMNDFAIRHDDHVQDRAAQIRDAQPFYEFVSLKLPPIVQRLREKMS